MGGFCAFGSTLSVFCLYGNRHWADANLHIDAGRDRVRLPLEDRSLRIIPPMSRWVNKKETMSIEQYRYSIGIWKLE